jgi:aspartate/methionine/tyrosine aminotransferase
MRTFPPNDISSLVGTQPQHNLGESFGPNLHLKDVLVGMAGLDELELSYGTVAGDPGLRAVIAAAHGVDADDVVITAGGVHALFLLAFILCGDGGEAVTTAPLFPLASNGLTVSGGRVHTIPLSFDAGYRIVPAEIRKRLSPATALVSFASPQNPSGVAIPPATIREIVDSVAELAPRAFVLVDETYREATYGDDPIRSSAGSSSRVITVASLSKCHGAPGLRIGWAITQDAALREQLLLGKFNTVISCSPIDETLARQVLETAHHTMPARRQHLAHGFARTAAWISAHNAFVEWVRPDAGAVCCARLRSDAFDDAAVERFHAELDRVGVSVAKGSWFGAEHRVFRLGFGLLESADFDEALAAVTGVLERTANVAANA